MRLPLALLAVSAAFAAAAPAQAADLTLDVLAHGTITVDSSSDDGLGNTETLKASVDLEHQIWNLWLPEGQKEASSPFMGQRLFGTTVGATRVMNTHEGPLRWECSALGEAAGAAGDLRVRRSEGDLLLDVGIQQGLEGNTQCTGPTPTGSSYRLISKPLVASLRIPASALDDGSEVIPVRNLPVTCIQGDHCSGSFSGSVNLSTEVPQQEQPPAPGPVVPAPGPTPTPKPGQPAKPSPGGKPKVKAKRTKRGAKVTVTCAGGCGGKISALSVARSKQLAAKPFKTNGSTPKVVVLKFPKHTRGNVVIDVRSGTTKQRVRLGR